MSSSLSELLPADDVIICVQEEDEMSQSADQFEQIDLSDEYEDDESTCSHESGNENEVCVPHLHHQHLHQILIQKAEKTSSTSYQDIGKAQTTNERVDAAMSTMWLPGNQPRCQFNQPPSFPSSVDIQSSDDGKILLVSLFCWLLCKIVGLERSWKQKNLIKDEDERWIA